MVIGSLEVTFLSSLLANRARRERSSGPPQSTAATPLLVMVLSLLPAPGHRSASLVLLPSYVFFCVQHYFLVRRSSISYLRPYSVYHVPRPWRSLPGCINNQSSVRVFVNGSAAEDGKNPHLWTAYICYTGSVRTRRFCRGRGVLLENRVRTACSLPGGLQPALRPARSRVSRCLT